MEIFKKFFKKEDENKIENELKEIFENDDLEAVLAILLELIAIWETDFLESFCEKFWTKEGFNQNDIKIFNEKIDEILLKSQKKVFIEEFLKDNFKKWFFYHSIWDLENALVFYDKKFDEVNEEMNKRENKEETTYEEELADLEKKFPLFFNTANIEFHKKNYKDAMKLYKYLTLVDEEKFKDSLVTVYENLIYCLLNSRDIENASKIYKKNEKFLKKNHYFYELFRFFDAYQIWDIEKLRLQNIIYNKLTILESKKIFFYLHHFLTLFWFNYPALYFSQKLNTFWENWNLNLKEFFEKNKNFNHDNIANFSVENLFKLNFLENNFEEAKKYYDQIMDNLENFYDLDLFIELMIFEKKFWLNHKNSEELKDIKDLNIFTKEELIDFSNSVENKDFVYRYFNSRKSLLNFLINNEDLDEETLDFLIKYWTKTLSIFALKESLEKTKKENNSKKYFELFEMKFTKNFPLKTEEPYLDFYLEYFLINFKNNPEADFYNLIEEIFETKTWEHTFNEVLFYLTNSEKIKKEDKAYIFFRIWDLKKAKKLYDESNLKEKDPSNFYFKNGFIKFCENNFEDAILDFVESQKESQGNLEKYLNSSSWIFASLVELWKLNEAKNMRLLIWNLLKWIENPDKFILRFLSFYENILEFKENKSEENFRNLQELKENKEFKSDFYQRKIKKFISEN